MRRLTESAIFEIYTFGGCTAGPAAALENMRILEHEGLLNNAASVALYLAQHLRELCDKHPILGDVRGEGLLVDCELVQDRDTKEPVDEKFLVEVVANCMEGGVLISQTNHCITQCNSTIILCPARIAREAAIDETIEAFETALSRVTTV